ncbi:MAG: serine/threonine protein kinase [Akkermansiaceae bacterium]|nr:serine/threonine protein kinase [Akkermansiaceae bacterium]MCP5544393.1 serine/threonine protein kinase [Akkermansiaceae bacterium]MCP5547463.1 serine/threonine protein kinase [Akkermansiaceae bacterium]
MIPKDNPPVDIHREVHLGRILGEGGMGCVLDGFAPDLGQHLAVKRLLPEWMEDQEIRSRFEEEIAIMASIDHPGVLPVYGMGLDAERRLFYVMKKVEGKTLGQLIWDPREPVTSVPRRKRLLGMLLDACETVAAAHDKGIIHRDIKPANILIDQAGSVYVIDWGLAKHIGTAGSSSSSGRTLPGKIMGTPGYMAPEQAEGRSAAAGTEADVFALGAILYEILTDKRPFEADTDRAELLGSIHRDPEHPRRLNLLVPRDICAICLKALNKNPAERYANAGGLAADLRAHLEGRPVSAKRPNIFEKIRFASRRHPMRALVATSTAVALLVLGSFIGFQRWIDLQLADKAMVRLSVIDSELTELEQEAIALQDELDGSGVPETEHERIRHELDVTNARWVLGQFDALRILSSVGELRFIRTSSEVHPIVRERMLTVIHTAIERKRPALAEGMIATLLERNEEGTLANPLSPEDVKLLGSLAKQAADASAKSRE